MKPAPQPVAEKPGYKYYVLSLLIAVCTLSWVDRQIFSILMESIRLEFGLSDTQLGLLGGVAFGLFYATFGLPIAWFADRLNRRNIVALSLCAWSAMTAWCSLATGFTTLLLGRIGIGIGEAGGASLCQSLVADYFPARRRGLAFGLFGLYLPLGFMGGFLIGGWIDQWYGWRAAFLVAGLPGLALALILRFTLREPARPPAAAGTAAPATSLAASIRYFLRSPAMRHITFGGAVHGIGAWGVAVWVPTYFMRTHGMGSGEVGLWMACAFGLAGSAGTICGGRLADHLVGSTGDVRWYVRLNAISLIVVLPFAFLTYLWSTPVPALVFFFIPAFLSHMILGPIMAMIQSLAGPRRRTQGAAWYLFLANLVSMGLGPLIIGMVSDFFHASYGTTAIRYAILSLLVAANVWSSWHFFAAGRTLKDDLARADAS